MAINTDKFRLVDEGYAPSEHWCAPIISRARRGGLSLAFAFAAASGHAAAGCIFPSSPTLTDVRLAHDAGSCRGRPSRA
jgi:hypothetical protein